MARDFAAEIAEARRALDGPEAFEAAHALCGLEEEWARALLGLSAAESIAKAVQARAQASLDAPTAPQAAEHLAASERWQRVIGGYATGAGEGLASMAKVYELQMAQAWVAAALGRAGQRKEAARARKLVAQVEKDSNGQGKAHARAIRALRAWLAQVRGRRSVDPREAPRERGKSQ